MKQANSSKYAAFTAELEADFKQSSGKWSVFFKDLRDGQIAEVYNGRLAAASLIKLFVMELVRERIAEKFIEDTPDISRAIHNMIANSSNTSTNLLLEALGVGDWDKGRDRLNSYAQKNGYVDTLLERKLGSTYPDPQGLDNYTSPRDVGLILERIYEKDKKGDSESLKAMKRQMFRGKIPQGLPPYLTVANKTGELPHIENDSAIVYTPQGDYILVVMSNDQENEEAARLKISSISAKAYRHFLGE